jgi:hypothetical protein
VFWDNNATCRSWAQKRNYFWLQKSLVRFRRNGKQFLENDLQHNFVQFIGTVVSHDITHNISKNWAQRIYGF